MSKNLNIGKEFHSNPSGRFYTDGKGSGERFREEFLKIRIATLAENEKLKVILDDGVEGYGSSFLTEGFAGMVKYGYCTSDLLLSKLSFSFEDQDFGFYRDKIIKYIQDAVFNSATYKSTK